MATNVALWLVVICNSKRIVWLDYNNLIIHLSCIRDHVHTKVTDQCLRVALQPQHQFKFLSMMATAKIIPQIEVQSLAADVEQTCDELEKEKELHLSINYVSYNSDELRNGHTSLS